MARWTNSIIVVSTPLMQKLTKPCNRCQVEFLNHIFTHDQNKSIYPPIWRNFLLLHFHLASKLILKPAKASLSEGSAWTFIIYNIEFSFFFLPFSFIKVCSAVMGFYLFVRYLLLARTMLFVIDRQIHLDLLLKLLYCCTKPLTQL
jgi:hypothetical protein